jgi:hypothetical protein
MAHEGGVDPASRKPAGLAALGAAPTRAWGSVMSPLTRDAVDAIDRLWLVISVLVFADLAPTYAQADRHGNWSDLGLGYGSASLSCDTCSGSQRLGGWTASFDIGGTLSPNFRLGADVRVWSNGLKAGGRLPGILTGTLLLTYYPRTRGGPFVEGGGGLSYYDLCKGTGDPIEPCSRDTTYSSGTGWGFTAGAGWEIPTGRSAFRPLLAFHHGAVRRLHSPDGATVATGWKQSLLTVELRWLVNLSR